MSEPIFISLDSAYFCVSCETITDASDNCPKCGAHNLYPMANWLGKVKDSETEGPREAPTQGAPY